MSSYQNSWSDAIQAWYDEVKDWRYGMGSINGGVVGHFTQVHFAHSLSATRPFSLTNIKKVLSPI